MRFPAEARVAAGRATTPSATPARGARAKAHPRFLQGPVAHSKVGAEGAWLPQAPRLPEALGAARGSHPDLPCHLKPTDTHGVSSSPVLTAERRPPPSLGEGTQVTRSMTERDRMEKQAVYEANNGKSEPLLLGDINGGLRRKQEE